jgi:hypothetical protein
LEETGNAKSEAALAAKLNTTFAVISNEARDSGDGQTKIFASQLLPAMLLVQIRMQIQQSTLESFQVSAARHPN